MVADVDLAPLASPLSIERLQRHGLGRLERDDRALAELLERESRRQHEVLSMVAASSMADPAVLVCEGTALSNVTTEGYPGARFHAGCEVVDEIEELAAERARLLFGARYANVQPHSGSSANAVVIFSLLAPGDTLLGMDLDAGGHLTHGSRASVIGNVFRCKSYGVDAGGLLDYDEIRRIALLERPRLIVCGASAYPRVIDFSRFRAIADEVGAYLLADISHIAGLVAAGLHPSPIDAAHVTTTSTYKQLYGPRGGLVLLGAEHDALAPDGKTPLWRRMQRGCFPFVQGTPNLAAVAAKAHAFLRAAEPSFRALMQRVIEGARVLAEAFSARGYRVLTGGTDNHMVLIDVLARGLTGLVAERALESVGIIVNKNRIAGDQKSAQITSGLRFGSNTLALRGMDDAAMRACAELVHAVLEAVEPHDDRSYRLDPSFADRARREVAALCRRHPVAGYPGEAA